MKEIGLWGGQGTNPPPGPKKSGVVAYCLVSVPHRGAGAHVPTSAVGRYRRKRNLQESRNNIGSRSEANAQS
jgi:hypothetical protein